MSSNYFENFVKAAGEYGNDLIFDAKQILVQAKLAEQLSSQEFNAYCDDYNMDDTKAEARATWAQVRNYDGEVTGLLKAYSILTLREVRHYENEIQDEIEWLNDLESVVF